MTSRTSGAAAIALILASGISTGALAQARRTSAPAPARAAAPAAAAPAPQNIRQGPVLPGICVLSVERGIGLSAAGRAAAARMQQLGQQAQAELSAQQTTLQNDANTLQSQRASLTQEQLQQRATALQQRAEAFDRLRQTRDQELQYTAGKAKQRIFETMRPLIIAAYQQHNCSIMVTGESVLEVNPAMDLTEMVVQQLNTRMPTITFDREALPANATPAH